MEPFFSTNPEIKKYVKENFDRNDKPAIENTIQYLKEQGLSQLQSVFLLTNEAKISFQEANSYVLNSKAWNTKK